MQESHADQPETSQVAGASDAAADASAAPEAAPASDAVLTADDLAKELLHGLGFCGHYMHFHGGGMSGRAPIICFIAKRGGDVSQQELGASFELKPGSLSEVLNKMEVAGLIERERNPEDRRQLTIRLTEAGVEQARLEQESRTRFRSEAFTCLTDAEKLELLGMLRRIRTRWEELDA
ncbi:MarR family transcriptional regulator [Collinsella sp. An7]|uniref:MarR family winged helix-turn-helix transcriptional regulator n=1 Tax=Collinsella sp. An7 TaxID=1965651 RepID=UPI000B37FBF1|nr:MarR family transcriptional regulator [Collinsella sp. An7]OUN46304.1 MarR family transcriptional regulator [Collinsella sp. An7]